MLRETYKERIADMQTFLPYEDFERSARVLDRARLGKQRIETYQILLSLKKQRTGEKAGWENHPAVKMWKGHERALCLYGITMCKVWIERGYKDTTLPKIEALMEYFPERSIESPWWLGDERLHRSHRSKLIEKDFLYYTLPFIEDNAGEDYFWPSQEASAS